MERSQAAAHSLDVKPLSSESHFRKSKHEVFPNNMKAIYVSPTNERNSRNFRIPV